MFYNSDNDTIDVFSSKLNSIDSYAEYDDYVSEAHTTKIAES